MPDDPPDPAQQLADDLLTRHNGDAHAALADLARLYLVARHGWCAGFDRAPPSQGSRS
ncbi:MAG: hypothetical protein ACLGJC_21330 [Alphaproteobacteria bacterium]